MSTVAIDQAQRDQAAQSLHRSIALEAGAGAGKTSVLVQRLIELLLHGLEPSRIAAITFTERAAGELLVRVRDALEARVQGAQGEQRERLEGFIDGLAGLRISTIHAFCKALLEAEALEAAWAPGTKILGSGQDGGVFEAAFDQWLQQFRAKHPELGPVLREHCSPSALRQAARILLDNRDVRPMFCTEPIDWKGAWDDFAAIAGPLTGAFSTACLNPNACNLYAGLRPLMPLIAAAAKKGAASLPALLDDLPKVALVGRQGDWKPGVCAEVKAHIKALRAWSDHYARERFVPLHGVLVASLWQNLVPVVQKERRANAIADFGDLLQRALALLDGNDGARQRLAASFDAILIDEVQDTDPVQSRIALLLARPLHSQGAWNAHPPLPGKLFAVGDPKQSIYRFRRADVAMWRSLRAAITATEDHRPPSVCGTTLTSAASLNEAKSAVQGQALRLQQNFRSVPGIVDWCNYTFSQMPQFEPQLAARRATALAPVVLLQSSGDELDAVVRYLWSLQRSEPMLGEAPRRMRWSDIMLLLPSWSQCDELQERLLSSGIPCLVEGGNAFGQRDEIRLSLAALRAMNEPGDGESVVFVLRGLFGLSFEQLAEHVNAGGSWRYTLPTQPSTAAAPALQVLRRLHQQRDGESWVRLLDALLSECAAPAVWALTARGHASLANLDKLRVCIRQVEAQSHSASQALTQLEALLREPDKELPLADFDSDAVRITSYFAAKGREAAVVVLSCCDRRMENVHQLVERGDGEQERLYLKAGELVPRGWAQAEANEKAAAMDERRRWLYVAATRAREQLVIVRREGESKLLEADIAGGLPHGGAHGTRQTVAPGLHVLCLEQANLEEVEYTNEAFPGLQSRIETLLDGPHQPSFPSSSPNPDHAPIASAKTRCIRWQSVSQRLSRRRFAQQPSQLASSQDEDVLRIGSKGGTLVHAVLERLDLRASKPELQHRARALLSARALQQTLDADFVQRCERVLMGILGHEVFDRARLASELWQETPFSLKQGTRIVSGAIDLCFPVDAQRRRWVVVDYKANVPTAGSLAYCRYQAQLAEYAKAMIALVEPCEEVETVLVGPQAALDNDEQWLGLLGLLHEALREGVRSLLESGVERPVVGFDPDLPSGAELELAWPDQQYGLLLDPEGNDEAELAAAGWSICVANSLRDGWEQEVLEALRLRFGSAQS